MERSAAAGGALPAALLACLALAGLALSATVVPGVFIVDEDNYLASVVALRHGRVSMPGLDGLPHSKELFYFEPAVDVRQLPPPPVRSSAPPLYSFLALPFSALGWRGLVALNTLAFLGSVALVFDLARRAAGSPRAGWLAAAAFGLGSFAFEYAQGVWPHMLSVLLVTAAAWLAARSRAEERAGLALAAGLAAGLACGVRYQNAVPLLGLAAGLVAWSRRRAAAGAAYGLGGALPLLLCSLVNQARQGSWNPISKAPGYLSLDKTPDGGSGRSLGEILHVLWARLVDFSSHPAPSGSLARIHGYYLRKDETTGAFELLGGAWKKAWLQSSPWVALALLVLALAWWGGRGLPATRPGVRRELQAFSLVVAPVLLVFAYAGFGRADGLCYNQRYFHELVPFAAIALAWALEPFALRGAGVLAGGLAALLVLALVETAAPDAPLRALVLMKAPLLLASALVGAWLAARAGGRHALLSPLLGLCIGWGLGVHVLDDLPASRGYRVRNAARHDAVAAVLPDGPAALLAYWGSKDAYGPLQLQRDLVIADAWADGGVAAPALLDAWLAQQRRVFVLASALPPELRDPLLHGRRLRGTLRLPLPGERPLELVEVTR